MREILSQFNFWSAIDILIIAYVLYHIVLFIRGTRAAQMMTGILIMVGAYLLSKITPLTTLKSIMDTFVSSFIIIIIILFQDDIRHALRRMGKKPFIQGTETISSNQIIDEITRASATLASRKIGALVVIERDIILSRYIDIGTLVDARVSHELLVSVFQPSSPIHDGAVIIQNGRIAAAGCFLPLTREENLDPEMGTRHRAAFGVSQETDALVVLVSEERGTISLVEDGRITKNLEPRLLRRKLRSILAEEVREETIIPTKRVRWSKDVLDSIMRFIKLGGKNEK